MLRTIILIMILSVIAGAAFADDIEWTGAAGDNKWENPANWQGGKVPGANDDVWIYPGLPVCVLPDRSITISRLYIEDQAKVKAGTSQINAHFFSNDGTIDVTARLRVNPKDEQGLNFSNTGEINAANASLSLGVTNHNNKYDIVDISNSGVIDGKTITIMGDSFANYKYTYGDKIFINVQNDVFAGVMSVLGGKTHDNSPGGSIWIFAKDLYIRKDAGLISAGNGHNSQGGSVYIWLRGKFINRWVINAGSGKKMAASM